MLQVSIRVCRNCSIPKPIAAFKPRNKARKDGVITIDSVCRACRTLKRKLGSLARIKRRVNGGARGEKNPMSKMSDVARAFVNCPEGQRIKNVVLAHWLNVEESTIHYIRKSHEQV